MKKKSPAQLDREIAEALRSPRPKHAPSRAKPHVAHSTSKKMTKQRVLMDMSRALHVEPADLEVIERRPYDKSFEVNLGSHQSYAVVPNEEVARKIALARVKEDLKDEPQIFNQSFIKKHIDHDALKKWVYKTNLEDDYVNELAAYQVDDFWDLARRLDVDKVVPDHDEDGNALPPTRAQVTAVKKARAEDEAKDPMRYFENFGDDPVKQAIKAAGIDIKAAAEDAVETDGWQHFLAHYDGKSHTTDSGLVYWRTN